MNINITKILEQGEGISIEFKKATKELPKTLFETICAFLNRNGGVILLGVDDNKKVFGTDKELAQNIAREGSKKMGAWIVKI
jgi:ATP-dependent DNA helicase RecG